MFLTDAAKAADREIPRITYTSDASRLVYFSVSSQEELSTLAFVIASFTKQQNLEYAQPKQTDVQGIYSLDITPLQWGEYEWNRFIRQFYPYDNFRSYTRGEKETYRADWFISYVTDANDNSAGYALTYGFRNIPKNKKEFLAYWKVNTEPEYAFGLIEGESRVAKQHTRWIENFSIPRGYVWGTRDFFKIDPFIGKNPYPPDNAKIHDGEEWIVGYPKFSSASGERGTLQFYMLFDAKGNRIDKADGDLVEDHTRYKGFSQIRSHGSCIQCHISGINSPTKNELRSMIISGQDLYAKYDGKEAIERFHLSDTEKEIRRNNEDYATAIFALTVTTPEENAKSFRSIIDTYQQRVGLVTAARELNTLPKTLALAIAYESNTNKDLGPYITGLPHDRKMNRETWEAVYPKVQHYLRIYEALQK